MVFVNRAPKINETVSRTIIDRNRAVENAGYYARKNGFHGSANPYADCDGDINCADAQLWLDGWVEADWELLKG